MSGKIPAAACVFTVGGRADVQRFGFRLTLFTVTNPTCAWPANWTGLQAASIIIGFALNRPRKSKSLVLLQELMRMPHGAIGANGTLRRIDDH